MVCDACNQYLGDNLELALARDTFEGTSRFEFKLKKPADFKSLGKQSRMIIRVAEGEYKGTCAYREYSQEQEKVVIKPLPQIGFLRATSSEYKYFLLDEVPNKTYLEESGFDLNHPKGIIIFGISIQKAKSVLSQKGINLVVGGEIEPSEGLQKNWLCEVEGKIDAIIFRSIAKIGLLNSTSKCNT